MCEFSLLIKIYLLFEKDLETLENTKLFLTHCWLCMFVLSIHVYLTKPLNVSPKFESHNIK